MMTAGRVRLVPLAETHLPATLEWVNDPAMMRLLGRLAPVDADEHRAWFAGLRDRRDCQYFAVELIASGRHVGNVWLWDIDRVNRRAEVRILFGDDASRGRGYGSDALDAVAQIAFATVQLHRLYAYVFVTNPRAKRAFEKAGFQTEGFLRQERRLNDAYVDVHVLARLSSDAPITSPHAE
jgi:RimJ/RimL family protein N-acetyltransferase